MVVMTTEALSYPNSCMIAELARAIDVLLLTFKPKMCKSTVRSQ